MKQSVTILGSGKVASQLALTLFSHGIKILEIYGRRIEMAERIASDIGARAVDSLERLNHAADLYIIAVSDDAIEKVQADLSPRIKEAKIVVHTSGFSSIHKLSEINHRGVFYPLNSFVEGRHIDFRQTPIFIDSQYKEDGYILRDLASTISDKVEEAGDSRREQLHVSAVIASNFSVGLIAMAEKLMGEAKLSMDYLKPLMDRTYQNLLKSPAKEVITGPAVRGDMEIVHSHLRKLEKHNEIKHIYHLISQYITDNLKNEKA